MISVLVSVLAATVAGPSPSVQASTPSVSGLISTSHMAVRATVVDRCAIGLAGAVCQGPAPIRPVAVDRPSTTRISIVF